MNAVDTLISAMLDADADALVLHVGERPAIATAGGHTALPAPPLTLTAVSELLQDLLPLDAQLALDEFGAVESEVPPGAAAAGHRLSVVAARGGDDIWIEIRRQRPFATDRGRQPERPGTSSPHERTRPGMTTAPAPPSLHAVAADEPRAVAGAGRPRHAEAGYPDASPVADNVLPLARSAVRPDPRVRPAASPRLAGLDRLLRIAAARGAEALYVTTGTRPSVRVDGDLHVLDGEAALSAGEVEALLLETAPSARGDSGEVSEWTADVPDVGRIRCVSFQDHRGPGGVFHLIAARALSAEQLGLSREIQALSAEPEGLLVVAGPRSSGKSSLLAALVDGINRTRPEHVITLETRIAVVHDSRTSLVSQREVRGDSTAMLAALRNAVRENPDVIVIEDLRGADVIAEALEAATSGRLVIAGVTARSAAAALARLVDAMPADARPASRTMIAGALRAVVAQVLLRKPGGGRIAARELLLNTPAIAQLIADGRLAQLPVAMEGGRRIGMVPLTDALVAFVQNGIVDVREAWRQAADRDALINALKREGIDTSFAERRA